MFGTEYIVMNKTRQIWFLLSWSMSAGDIFTSLPYHFIVTPQLDDFGIIGWKSPRFAVCKLETQESQCPVAVWIQRPENRESWWYKFQSKSQQAWNPRRADVSVQDWSRWLRPNQYESSFEKPSEGQEGQTSGLSLQARWMWTPTVP